MNDILKELKIKEVQMVSHISVTLSTVFTWKCWKQCCLLQNVLSQLYFVDNHQETR